MSESNRAALNQLCENLGDVALALTLTANALREGGLALEQALSGMGAGTACAGRTHEALDLAFGAAVRVAGPRGQILASAWR